VPAWRAPVEVVHALVTAECSGAGPLVLAGHARPNRCLVPVVACSVDHHDTEPQTGLRRDRALVDQAVVQAVVAVAAVAPVAVVRRQSDVVGDMNGS